jgi:predicted NUDIX family phosphoesterase
VGKVHIGVVHLLEITSGEIKSFEKQLLDVRLSSIDELQMEIHLFETWSQMLIPFLKTYLGS